MESRLLTGVNSVLSVTPLLIWVGSVLASVLLMFYGAKNNTPMVVAISLVPLAIPMMIFPVIVSSVDSAITAATPPHVTTVSTSSIVYATGDVPQVTDTHWQSKALYLNGKHIVIYGDNITSTMRYKVSNDGTTWGSAATYADWCRSEDRFIQWPVSSNTSNLYFSGRVPIGNPGSFVQRNTVNDNNTISFGTAYTVDAASDWEDYNSAVRLTDGKSIFTYTSRSDNLTYCAVFTDNGTQIAGSPFLMNAVVAEYQYAKAAPMLSGQAFVTEHHSSTGTIRAYLWNGANFTEEWNINTAINWADMNTLLDGRVMVVATNGANTQYRIRSTAGAWGSWTTLSDVPANAAWLTLSTNTTGNELFLTWCNNAKTVISGMRWYNGAWDSPVTIVTTTAIARPAPVSRTYQSILPMAYVTGAAYLYVINYCYVRP